jgi:hypothetical protein
MLLIPVELFVFPALSLQFSFARIHAPSNCAVLQDLFLSGWSPALYFLSAAWLAATVLSLLEGFLFFVSCAGAGPIFVSYSACAARVFCFRWALERRTDLFSSVRSPMSTHWSLIFCAAHSAKA